MKVCPKRDHDDKTLMEWNILKHIWNAAHLEPGVARVPKPIFLASIENGESTAFSVLGMTPVLRDVDDTDDLPQIFLDVLAALDQCKRAEVLHRDISSDNILVSAGTDTSRPVGYLIDFNVAVKFSDVDVPLRLSEVTGKWNYLSRAQHVRALYYSQFNKVKGFKQHDEMDDYESLFYTLLHFVLRRHGRKLPWKTAKKFKKYLLKEAVFQEESWAHFMALYGVEEKWRVTLNNLRKCILTDDSQNINTNFRDILRTMTPRQ